MSDSALTVIMPLFRQPNFLATALYGLVKNSTTNPKIIVVWSRQEAFVERSPRPPDWLVYENRERFREYATVQEFIARHGTGPDSWCARHNITFYDATEEGHALRSELGDAYIDGTDSAYKINLGIGMAETEYIVPNYDADFFPSEDWDGELYRLMREHNGPKQTWIPTHVQPKFYEVLPAWAENDELEASREIACTHLTWPVSDPLCILHEDDWDDLSQYGLYGKRPTIIEACGERRQAHWNPQAFRTEEFREYIKGFPWGTGTDLEVDNIAARAGFMKASSYRSFILHKASVAMPRNAFDTGESVRHV